MMKSPVVWVLRLAADQLQDPHMAVEDIAVTRTIPGLSVFSPVDNTQLAATLMGLQSIHDQLTLYDLVRWC